MTIDVEYVSLRTDAKLFVFPYWDRIGLSQYENAGAPAFILNGSILGEHSDVVFQFERQFIAKAAHSGRSN